MNVYTLIIVSSVYFSFAQSSPSRLKSSEENFKQISEEVHETSKRGLFRELLFFCDLEGLSHRYTRHPGLIKYTSGARSSNPEATSGTSQSDFISLFSRESAKLMWEKLNLIMDDIANLNSELKNRTRLHCLACKTRKSVLNQQNKSGTITNGIMKCSKIVSGIISGVAEAWCMW